MSHAAKPFLAAAVQAAPVFLDREASVAKACALIAQAAARGAKLIVLPEAFVPAYPAWVWFLPLTRRADVAALYRELVENSVDVPGPEVERLGCAAREAQAWVAIGINERNATKSATTLYNTLLLFNDRGELVERHRKLMPTGGERMVWTQGEPVPLRVHDTPLGRLSGLICWENYMPLARFSLYEQGAQIHMAPTWDKSDQWIASMRHIAREGRVYVIGVCQALHRDRVPDRYPFKDTLPAGLQWINVGNSLIVDPEGVVIAGPVAEREEILLAEIDSGRTSGSRWIFDAAGHYNRPDLFKFEMRGQEEAAVADGGASRPAKAARRHGASVNGKPRNPARKRAVATKSARPRKRRS
ncbi:MAG: carbon-nitrogen hydrolase family protein [Candidatus Eisenbacteria bacterium]